MPGDLGWLDTPSCELLRADLVTLVFASPIGCCLLLKGDFVGTSVLAGGCLRFSGDLVGMAGAFVGVEGVLDRIDLTCATAGACLGCRGS